MNKLNRERQVQVVKALVEGNGINGTVRMTGVAKNTILKLLADLGAACLEYQDNYLHDLKASWIQCDEIWECIFQIDEIEEDMAQRQFYISRWEPWGDFDPKEPQYREDKDNRNFRKALG